MDEEGIHADSVKGIVSAKLTFDGLDKYCSHYDRAAKMPGPIHLLNKVGLHRTIKNALLL